MHSTLRQYLRAAFGLVSAVLIIGCTADSSTAPARELGEFVLSASVQGTAVSTLVVKVTATDITTPLAFNIEVVDGKASGTIKVPPGSQRTITIMAFDALGIQTHEGAKTVNVKPGANPPVSIALISRHGELPIDITMGSVSVVVSPSTRAMTTGTTLALQVTIETPNGDAVTGVPSFATLNPGIASVNAQGIVTARNPGTVTIVASYAGVGASATIQVSPPRVAIVTGSQVVILDAATLEQVDIAPLGTAGYSVDVEAGRAYVGGNSNILEIDLITRMPDSWPQGSVSGIVHSVTVRDGVLYAIGFAMTTGVHKFNLDGTPLGTIAPQSGNFPWNSAFGPDGSFYLAVDIGAQRWEPGFVAAGSFVGGSMTSAQDIGVRSNGNVLVADRGPYAIFTSNGSYIGSVPACQSTITGLAVDAADGVWVICESPQEVVKFNAQNQVVARKFVHGAKALDAY